MFRRDADGVEIQTSLLWLIHRLNFRRLLVAGVALFALAIVAVVSLRAFSAWQASGKIYTSANVPSRPVAIVFGARVYGDGRLSAMLADRVTTAAQLYHAGKVQALLLTGDNSLAEYNEPEAMRQVALDLGVAADAIVLDYAGFRTYDSCYRARDIFQVDAAILVTQDFHLDRALLVCNQLGIDSVGVAADAVRPTGYARGSMFSSLIREFPATALSVLDLIRNIQPTYLGEPLPIFGD
jgi:SanA protein